MSYITAFNNYFNSTGAGSKGWKECEKENYFYPLTHSASQGSIMNFNNNMAPPPSSFHHYQQQRSISPTPASVPVIKSELDTLVTFLAKFDSKVAAIWGSDENEQEAEKKKQMINDNNMMMMMMLNGDQDYASTGRDGTRAIREQGDIWGQPLSSTEASPNYNKTNKINFNQYQDEVNNNNIENHEAQLQTVDDEDMIVEEDLLTSGKTHFKPIQEAEDPCFGFWSFEDPTGYATYKRTAENTFPLRFKIRNENDKAVQTDDNFYDNNYSTSTSFVSCQSPWNTTTSATSSLVGFGSDEEDGVAAATDKLYLW